MKLRHYLVGANLQKRTRESMMMYVRSPSSGMYVVGNLSTMMADTLGCRVRSSVIDPRQI